MGDINLPMFNLFLYIQSEGNKTVQTEPALNETITYH